MKLREKMTNEDLQEKLELLELKVHSMDEYLATVVFWARNSHPCNFDHIEKIKRKKK